MFGPLKTPRSPTAKNRHETPPDAASRSIAWLDTGTHEALLRAANLVQAIEKRQGLEIACIEASAYRAGRIDRAHLEALASAMGRSSYGDYLPGSHSSRHAFIDCSAMVLLRAYLEAASPALESPAVAGR